MPYAVTKAGGTTNHEFDAYTRLLEDVGINVANAPRVPEQGTDRRWLYAWSREIEALRFAAELKRRTGDAGWVVHAFENQVEESGPVTPLEISRIPEEMGYRYYLTPASRQRVLSAFPGTNLPLGLSVLTAVEQDNVRFQSQQWWPEVARILTSRTDEEIDALGGVRIRFGDDAVAFERIPHAA